MAYDQLMEDLLGGNVGFARINHPPFITIFMGGIPHQKWLVYDIDIPTLLGCYRPVGYNAFMATLASRSAGVGCCREPLQEQLPIEAVLRWKGRTSLILGELKG